MNYGFDNERYLRIQSEHIKERIAHFGNKLYLELGGKLFDDYHASRVLPGFQPDSKLRMLSQLADQAEIVIVISAVDIEKNKIRNDLGITYDVDVLRLRTAFQQRGFVVNSVVVTHYNGQASADAFRSRLDRLGIRTYVHYLIDGYPTNVDLIASDEGFGKNDYVETTRPLVIVTAPGPGSGKMAVCLSQLYNEHKRGVEAGYAKFETFPVWSLPLKHPVNIAYEAATADLNDVNMIDPFHLEAYGKTAVNYNRDIEIFPVLNALFEGIYGENPYKSPTDMGVNMVGFCISDDDVCCRASKDEIIRRYFTALNSLAQGNGNDSEINKIALLFKQAKIDVSYRRPVKAARDRAEDNGVPCSAIELADGTIITAATSALLGPSAALILNAIKHLAGIDHSVKLIPQAMIEPIQFTKTNYLQSGNPRLHTEEVLVALSVLSTTDDQCRRALECLPQ
ncbi:MAG: DUF1846 domain-containing protein, partial [Muribaculum sp.]|nr:DUF1846 domain-containing protein [Muribaculum sp.]